MIKVTFKVNYSPRRKGETVELEDKLAQYYLSLGVAELCNCTGKTEKPCSDCEKHKEKTVKVATTKKKTTKK